VVGATHIAIGAARLGDVPVPDGKRLVTMCAGGTRAVLAGSLLKRVGYEPTIVAAGWVRRMGRTRAAVSDRNVIRPSGS